MTHAPEPPANGYEAEGVVHNQSAPGEDGEALLRNALRNLNRFTGPDPKALVDAARDDISQYLSALQQPHVSKP